MLTNNRKKEIISLKHKKFRQKYSQFLVEGEKSVSELYNSSFTIVETYATRQFLDKSKIKFDLSKILIISEKEMKSISSLENPPGIIAVSNFKDIKFSVSDFCNKLTLVLDNISDPGNLGTIIRIADWYGIENVICSDNSVDFYNTKTINSTMGSFTRVNVYYENIYELLAKTKVKKYSCVINGNSIQQISKPTEAIIIIGNESNGINDEIINISDYKITIPRIGKAESLNAAMAAAIISHKFVFG